MSEISKARYFWAVMYPENMIPDWDKKISDIIQYPFAYCIHDKDLRKECNEERKTHIHLIVAFNNTTTYNFALSVFSRLNAPGQNAIPNNKFEACINVSHCYDYLIHNTDECRKARKHLYDKSERVTGNNFDIALFECVSLDQKLKVVRDITIFVKENLISNFFDLTYLVYENWADDYLYQNVLAQYSSYFDRLCKGIYYKKRNEVKEYV